MSKKSLIQHETSINGEKSFIYMYFDFELDEFPPVSG